jgi:hypothetical protein
MVSCIGPVYLEITPQVMISARRRIFGTMWVGERMVGVGTGRSGRSGRKHAPLFNPYPML